MFGAPIGTAWDEILPWNENSGQVLQSVRNLIKVDGLVIGVMNGSKPRPDELLSVQGWSEKSTKGWCDNDAAQDPLLTQAKRRGEFVGNNRQTPAHSFKQYKHVLACMTPESLPERRWWWAVLGRNDREFEPAEQQLGSLLLRQWRTRFNQTPEPGMGRLLVGHDDRLINADPWTQVLLLQDDTFLPNLIESMHRIRSQRWDDEVERVTHDFAVELAGQVFWVCFQRCRAVSDPDGYYWYLEIRQLENDDLTAVGWIDDDRIAKSIAFIHDQYDQSPSLDQIAEAVSLSPFHFHRLFSKHVGISPKQYLQKKQLQMAKWLLRSSRDSIGSIAKRCGFSSHGHFTSTFTRLVEKSPSQYREKH